MGIYLGIDAGRKRIGLAVSDSTHVIASPLKTVNHQELIPEIQSLASREGLLGFVLGLPKDLKNRDTDGTAVARELEARLKRQFPQVEVHLEDERFTSKLAAQSMVETNLPRHKRQDKSIVDQVSAAIILQSFLDRLARTK